MSEKQHYSLLPTAANSAATATTAPNTTSSNDTVTDVTLHRRRLRIGFFKLCLVAAAFYTLFWMPLDDDSHDNDNTLNERSPSHHRHHHQGGHKAHHKDHHDHHLAKQYGFEKHMDAAVEQIVEGTLESK